MKQLQVAAGILRDDAGRVLIAERLGGGPFDGMWEFPGGKIGAAETAADALRRELAEELGITVCESEHFLAIHHEYPDRIVDLEFFLVTDWNGEPTGRQGQRLRWLNPSDIDPVGMLPANLPVVRQLQTECAADGREVVREK